MPKSTASRCQPSSSMTSTADIVQTARLATVRAATPPKSQAREWTLRPAPTCPQPSSRYDTKSSRTCTAVTACVSTHHTVLLVLCAGVRVTLTTYSSHSGLRRRRASAHDGSALVAPERKQGALCVRQAYSWHTFLLDFPQVTLPSERQNSLRRALATLHPRRNFIFSPSCID